MKSSSKIHSAEVKFNKVIHFNGAVLTLNPTIQSLKDLLMDCNLLNQRIAVEVNGEIVSRSNFEHTQINHEDKIEVIKAVGGG